MTNRYRGWASSRAVQSREFEPRAAVIVAGSRGVAAVTVDELIDGGEVGPAPSLRVV